MNPIPEETFNRIYNLSQGIPGAIVVIKQLMDFDNFDKYLTYFEENDIKGSAIWVLYKDEHKQDINELAKYLDSKI